MKPLGWLALLVFCAVGCSTVTDCDFPSRYTDDESELMHARAAHASSLRVEGGGPAAYAAGVADEFTAWTFGSKLVTNRRSWLLGIRNRYDAGWRLSRSGATFLDVSVYDDHGFVRCLMMEQSVGPDGETRTTNTVRSEVWVHRDGRWLLQRVELLPE